MQALRRHQLVWLDEDAWHRVLAAASPAPAHGRLPDPPDAAVERDATLDCLATWAQHGWPLVVTRQPAVLASASAGSGPGPDTPLALGLAAPARLGRRSISVTSSLGGVTRQGEFPPAADLLAELLPAAQPGWALLCERLASLGVPARVYGSYGWQRMTGLPYVHAASDIDLLVDVDTTAQADRVATLLQAADLGALRVDGELAFAHGGAVAWREWLQHRGGHSDRLLVKRLTGVALEDAGRWAVAA